ncbi:MAG: YebC/PmpR family DNA-binding transcriptional regulator [Verrucomicrobia bacterium]|nr:YebC/PmpR family DNA-binding transcriptional regulator [Verrucomicrobiota bacterium]
MAGHSKWANIKHRKERADARKGKAFSKVAKEIISAVKMGGADPESNPRLRLAIQKAKVINFPNESIERNIKKASSADQSDFFEINYELYGYGGVGLIVEVMTDNKNRIASEMRIATNKRGGVIASPGAVAYQFDLKGVVEVARDSMEEEKLFSVVTEAGADDFEVEEEQYLVLTAPNDLFGVKEAIEAAGGRCIEASLKQIPKNLIDVTPEQAQANLDLMAWLEELDDVDAVYHNMA